MATLRKITQLFKKRQSQLLIQLAEHCYYRVSGMLSGSHFLILGVNYRFTGQQNDFFRLCGKFDIILLNTSGFHSNKSK